jgi:hypothetical protein
VKKHGSPPEACVARAFNKYLVRIGLPTVRLEASDIGVGRHEAWTVLGFWIGWRIDPDDAGFPSLELYVYHPRMDDWHARIWADGYVEELEAMRVWIHFDPEAPGSRETAAEQNRERNRAIAIRLHERGLCPQGHEHHFLRSADDDPLGDGAWDSPLEE